jgi:hypothetical protein
LFIQLFERVQYGLARPEIWVQPRLEMCVE